jgi:hypothetical protein
MRKLVIILKYLDCLLKENFLGTLTPSVRMYNSNAKVKYVYHYKDL